MKEIEFKKETLRAYNKISLELLTDITLKIGTVDDDAAREIVTYMIETEIYSNLAEERELTYYFKRPKFFDWLFRRSKVATFELKVKDLLINPPPENTERIYIVNKKDY